MDKRDQANALNGSDLHYNEAGSGNAVFVLQAAQDSPLLDRLRESFRVVTLKFRESGDWRSVAQELSRAAEQLGIAKYCLIADSESAPAAIAHAIGSATSVEALILIAPSLSSHGGFDDNRLEQVEAPTLVLFGTRDEVVQPETGRVYARQVPKCFFTLVYDAGHNIGADRPQPLYAVVRDFLEHREKFVTPHESSVINP